MGAIFSKLPPTVKPRDERRVREARVHLEQSVRDKLVELGKKIQGQVLLAPKEEGVEDESPSSSQEEAEAYHRQRERTFFLNDANYPAAIVLVETVQDIVETVHTVEGLDNTKYQLAIAAGCHSHYCMVDNSIVLDLERLNSVSVDIDEQNGANSTITIGGGAKIKHAHEALAGTGYGFVTGTNEDTGVSGLTLAGGVGYLAGRGGFACDTVTEAEVVLPSGKLVVATDGNEYKDLLRALRGGGGNFGIVTRWTFRLYDVSNCFGGTVVHFAPSAARLKIVLDNFAKVVEDIPDAGSSISALPVGAPVFVTVATMTGDEVKDETSYKDIPFLSKMSSLGAWFLMSNDLARKDYIKEIAPVLAPVQQRTYSSVVGAMVYSFDEALRDALVHFTRVDYPGKNTKPVIIISMLNGAASRNDGSTSSLRHRKAVAWIIIEAGYEPDATEDQIKSVMDWSKRVKDKVMELGGEDGPHNFCDSDGRRIKFFNDEQRAFLEMAKKKYDPTNLLTLNKNIVGINSE